MRRAKRAALAELAVGELPGDGGDHGDLQQLARAERRQDRGQAGRQHRLAGARRADHQEVVAAGRGDLQRPLGAFLAAHLGKVGEDGRIGAQLRLRPGQDLRALEMVGELDQRDGRQDLHLRIGPSGFRAARRRADQAAGERVGADGGRQHAGDGGDRAVQRQLAEHHVALQLGGWQRAHRRHQGKGDGQVEMRALLGQVRRRKVDCDALGRQRQAGGDQCRTHPLAAFADRLVRQADDGEGDLAGADLHLHVDRLRLYALERDRGDPRDH